MFRKAWPCDNFLRVSKLWAVYDLANSHAMKPSDQSGPDMQDILHPWRVSPPPDPGFRPAVWSRIEARRTLNNESWAASIRRHAALWTTALLLAMTAAGLLGDLAGRKHADAERQQMLTAYLSAIDPTP
jgi:hypothetical protein